MKGINIEEKIIEIFNAKKAFADHYLLAKKQFNEIMSQQSKLVFLESNGQKISDDILISTTNNIKKLHEIINLILAIDPLILNSIKSPQTNTDYLFQHSINVCYVGTMVLRNFNSLFSSNINKMLNKRFKCEFSQHHGDIDSFRYYQKEAMETISIGYFMHDAGKIMLSQELLDKKEKLSKDELYEIRKHSLEYGKKILIINGIRNVYIENIVKYHHAPIYEYEKESYPEDKHSQELQPYVKICKLADIYSAMTSQKAYCEAINPIRAVNEIFRKYSGKDPMLQFILYAFMKEIGIYPVGSILTLKNGQLAYVISGNGHEVIIFNSAQNKNNEISDKVINLSDKIYTNLNLTVDSTKLPKTPNEVFDKMPEYLRELHQFLEQ